MIKKDRSSQHFARLIRKELLNELTPSEQAELDAFLCLSEANRRIYDETRKAAFDKHLFARWQQYDPEKALSLHYPGDALKQNKTLTWKRLLYPAAAAVLVFFGIWFGLLNDATQQVREVTNIDFQPASYQAIIQLSDGRTFELDQVHRTVVIGQEGISYENGNQVATIEDAADATMASISTPKGGTYEVLLPDGSKVILNAGSTLTHPVRFSSEARNVSVSGEAYFHVAKDVKPFIVETNRLNIHVLGTTFNVRAYEDETTTAATLVEGKVLLHDKRVDELGSGIQLVPGQTGWMRDEEQIRVHSLNLDAALAWTKGRFDFNGKTLREAMLEIGRWYDVEVEIQKNVPDIEFYGGTFRTTSLSTILSILENNSIHYELTQDRRLIVSKGK